MSDLELHENQDTPETNKTVFHLVELRRRLLASVYAIILVFASLFYFSNSIFNTIAMPLLEVLPNASNMVSTAVTGTFVAPLKLTFFLSIFIVMPFLFYQAWSFLAPGLYKHERRLIWPLLITSTLLFYLGVAFAYFVVFPLIFKFFVAIAPKSITVMPDISSYISLVLKLFFAFGVAFEVPIITVALIGSGLVSIESVKQKRPFVFVAAFVLGMLLTPPDVISQILLAVPLYILFELGILFSTMIFKKHVCVK